MQWRNFSMLQAARKWTEERKWFFVKSSREFEMQSRRLWVFTCKVLCGSKWNVTAVLFSRLKRTGEDLYVSGKARKSLINSKHINTYSWQANRDTTFQHNVFSVPSPHWFRGLYESRSNLFYLFGRWTRAEFIKTFHCDSQKKNKHNEN